LSREKTEGNGVGDQKEPPVSAKQFNQSEWSGKHGRPIVRGEDVGVAEISIVIGPTKGGVADIIGCASFGQTKADLNQAPQFQHGNVRQSKHLTFNCHLTDHVAFSWQTLLVDGDKLYISIPDKFLPCGSRDSLVSLLDYAESTLGCSDIVVYLRNDRPDRPAVMRLFMYLGFSLLDPCDPLVPVSSDNLAYMAYHVESDSSNDDDD
jgi:ornithine decarboxylase antizyme 1